MINANRLLKRMSRDGFELAWQGWLGVQFNFDYVRPGEIVGTFEHIQVDSMGRSAESVYCKLWVSPVRGHRLHFKPSPEVDDHLWEPADPDKSYAIVEDDLRAEIWERKVAEAAPGKVRELARQHAVRIAHETAGARRASLEYAGRIREISEETVMEYLEFQLSCRLTPAQQQHANLLSSGGISSDVAYAIRCAAMAVAMFGKDVDPDDEGFATEPARRSADLKLRLNIAADLLRFPSF